MRAGEKESWGDGNVLTAALTPVLATPSATSITDDDDVKANNGD